MEVLGARSTIPWSLSHDSHSAAELLSGSQQGYSLVPDKTRSLTDQVVELYMLVLSKIVHDVMARQLRRQHRRENTSKVSDAMIESIQHNLVTIFQVLSGLLKMSSSWIDLEKKRRSVLTLASVRPIFSEERGHISSVMTTLFLVS